MGEEGLERLGLPRRSFLTKAALTAFIAPTVVSFGLDGVAAADPSAPTASQCYSNQFHLAQQEYESLLGYVTAAGAEGIIASGIATALSATLVKVGTALEACDPTAATRQLDAFVHQVQGMSTSRLPAWFAANLTSGAEDLRNALSSV